MGIYYTDKLMRMADAKFKSDSIYFGYDTKDVSDFSLTKEEFEKLYILWNIKQYTCFQDFIDNITFMTNDVVSEQFSVPSRVEEVFDTDDMLEHFLHEQQEINGFIELSRNDLYVIVGWDYGRNKPIEYVE